MLADLHLPLVLDAGAQRPHQRGGHLQVMIIILMMMIMMMMIMILEVMLLTNREMVANISADLGEIFVETYPLPEWNQDWIKNRYKYDPHGEEINKLAPGNPANFIVNIGENETPTPFNLSLYKGEKSWAAPRKFVEFLLHHPVAQQFIGYSYLFWILNNI